MMGKILYASHHNNPGVLMVDDDVGSPNGFGEQTFAISEVWCFLLD